MDGGRENKKAKKGRGMIRSVRIVITGLNQGRSEPRSGRGKPILLRRHTGNSLSLRYFRRTARARACAAKFSRGWGGKALGSKPVRCRWTLFIQDLNGLPTSIPFDLFEDDSELAIGLNDKAFSSTNLLTAPPKLTLSRPQDDGSRVLSVYLDGVDPFKARLRLDVTLLPRLSRALIATPLLLRPRSLAKRIHRYTHAPAKEASCILRLAGYKSCKLHNAIEEVSKSCPLCAASGHPLPSKKASLSHVEQHFNEHLQADFFWIEIRGTKYVVLHAVDAGTGFSETTIVPARSASEMAAGLEIIWINRRGFPSTFASDYEFNSKQMNLFL